MSETVGREGFTLCLHERAEKQKCSGKRFLSWCKSLWYDFFSRTIPCITVINCWVSFLHIIDDQATIRLRLTSRCEMRCGESRAIIYTGPGLVKTQNILRSSSRYLFIPASRRTSNTPQVTVHGGRLSSGHRHNRRCLCHHSHSAHTWRRKQSRKQGAVRDEELTLISGTWGQSCSEAASSLHVRAARREQRVPSMLSVWSGRVSGCSAERWAGLRVWGEKEEEERRRGTRTTGL